MAEKKFKMADLVGTITSTFSQDIMHVTYFYNKI